MSETILVVDDEPVIGVAIARLLGGEGYRVDTTTSGEEAVELLTANPYDLVITDLTLEPMSGMDLLDWLGEHAAETPVIMITAFGSERTAVEAMKRGAVDYFPKPFDNDELVLVVKRALEERRLRRDNRLLRERVSERYRFDKILGKSRAMQEVFDRIRKVADTDLTVLILGPSGTGKELVANAIHYNSPRRSRPLIKVNCAAFPKELVESELFGHEKGAFTGASQARRGKFEVADGGSLFLDEIGDMSPGTQARVLRVLQEREFERVGGNRTIRVDVRVLAATNQELERKISAGEFREDLYYRLNVIPIYLPPLRDRPEDLPLLIEHFLKGAAERLERPSKSLSAPAGRALLEHDWKGNVRELKHAIEHAVALSSSDEIQVRELPASVVGADPAHGSLSIDPSLSFKEAKSQLVERFERQFIVQALERQAGNITRAAEEMGMYRQQLQQKLAKFRIDPAAFRRRPG